MPSQARALAGFRLCSGRGRRGRKRTAEMGNGQEDEPHYTRERADTTRARDKGKRASGQEREGERTRPPS
eukprot:8506817-Pyramimonas_sp.AAC.1